MAESYLWCFFVWFLDGSIIFGQLFHSVRSKVQRNFTLLRMQDEKLNIILFCKSSCWLEEMREFDIRDCSFNNSK